MVFFPPLSLPQGSAEPLFGLSAGRVEKASTARYSGEKTCSYNQRAVRKVLKIICIQYQFFLLRKPISEVYFRGILYVPGLEKDTLCAVEFIHVQLWHQREHLFNVAEKTIGYETWIQCLAVGKLSQS